MTTTIALVLCAYTIFMANALPQQNRRPITNVDPSNPDIQRAIEEVFNTDQPSQPSRGFDKVVTPDPTFVPTSEPTVLTNDGEQCTCIPYHMCDPSNSTMRGSSNDDEVVGFGVIDIRFDPDDCQDVLDVCCRGVNRREEPIIPKPVENKPTRAAGCGIRNVGGLDFQLAGAFVSETDKVQQSVAVLTFGLLPFIG